MTISKEWFAILISVELSARVLLGSESFNYALSPSTIQPGHHAVLSLRVPLSPKEDESSVLVNDSLLFNSPDLYVLEKSSERTSCCLILKYELTGYKSETYSLPPIEIKTPSNSFSTEKTAITVQSQRTQEDNELRESFDSLPIPFPLKKWAQRILLFLFSIGGVSYLYSGLRRLPRKIKLATPTPKPIPKEDPLLWLKSQLQQLKLRLEEDPNNEFLIDDWGQIIRGYVGKLNSAPALAWTTKELRKTTPEGSPIFQIIPCLETSDQFKFQTAFKDPKSITSLLTHFIAETETHLILCGN